jgi:hypothetical protein
MERRYIIWQVTILILSRILFCESKATFFNGLEEKSYEAISLGFPISNVESSNDHFEHNGTVALVIPSNACDSISNKREVNGRVAVVTSGDCLIDRKMRHVQEAGADVAIIFGYDRVDVDRTRFHSRFDDDSIEIRGVAISFEYQEEILEMMAESTGNHTMVTIRTDPNEYYLVASDSRWILLSIFIVSGNILLIGYSLYKMYIFIGVESSHVALFSFGSITIGAILRIVYSLDGFGINRLLNYRVRTVLYSLPLPFTYATTVWIGFYWLELFSARNVAPKQVSLKKYFPHCMVALAILFIMEVSTVSMRAALIQFDLFFIVTVCSYMIIDILCILFFAYNSWKIYDLLRTSRRIRKNADCVEKPPSQRVLNRLWILGAIKCVGFAMLLLIGVFYLTSLVVTRYEPFVLYPISYSTFLFVNIVQVLMFGNPPKNDDFYGTTSSSGATITHPNSAQKLPGNTRNSVFIRLRTCLCCVLCPLPRLFQHLFASKKSGISQFTSQSCTDDPTQGKIKKKEEITKKN